MTTVVSVCLPGLFAHLIVGLQTVFLSGNPVCESMSNWRVAFLLVCGPSLHKLDGVGEFDQVVWRLQLLPE